MWMYCELTENPNIKQLGNGLSSSYCLIISPVSIPFIMSSTFIFRSYKRILACSVIAMLPGWFNAFNCYIVSFYTNFSIDIFIITDTQSFKTLLLPMFGVDEPLSQRIITNYHMKELKKRGTPIFSNGLRIGIPFLLFPIPYFIPHLRQKRYHLMKPDKNSKIPKSAVLRALRDLIK